jgi:phenylpropionate dioxygenase-like ring-hydroxylating dioxygenase large terminal subunit
MCPERPVTDLPGMNTPLDDPLLTDGWHVVAQSRDMPDGKVIGCRLLGEDLVTWRSPGGVRVWRDLCIHRASRLSLGSVEGGCLVCPYHSWGYGSDGRCPSGSSRNSRTG